MLGTVKAFFKQPVHLYLSGARFGFRGIFDDIFIILVRHLCGMDLDSAAVIVGPFQGGYLRLSQSQDNGDGNRQLHACPLYYVEYLRELLLIGDNDLLLLPLREQYAVIVKGDLALSESSSHKPKLTVDGFRRIMSSVAVYPALECLLCYGSYFHILNIVDSITFDYFISSDCGGAENVLTS